METNPAPKPILVRAAITADEWTRLRQIALAERRPVQQLVADALRKAHPTMKASPK